jgi:hypothetical protein
MALPVVGDFGAVVLVVHGYGARGELCEEPGFEELESFCESRMGYQEGVHLPIGTPAVSAGHPKAGREQ